MGSDAFKAKLARVEALRSVDNVDVLLAGLHKALNDRSNYVVAKAAAIAGDRYVIAAIPDLIAAYNRLFENPVANDRLVLGKQAIARALKDLDYRDAAPFLRGLAHIQLEPVWGGSADAAGGLRATCAHALVASDIDGMMLLQVLIDHLVDSDKTVRIEVVRAIAQVGGHESMLVLRVKTLAGDAEAEVSGACFEALLAREPRESVPFVERFLAVDGAVAFEAVSALGAARIPEALTVVRQFWETDISLELRRAIVFSCAASALAEAAEFLLSIVADRRGDLAESALSALGASRFRHDVRERARQAAADADVLAAYTRAFEPA